ncbi:MAG: LPS biosynthesis protein, partial [Ignavibacteriae bacterium]|nr:LPS biosynthesis protein [Ignavibacteriota bacterium]
ESYWLPKRFGYDVRKVQYSSLILTNQMTREEALEKLKELPYDEEAATKEFEYVANKLDISIEELRSYLTMPKKTYKDYKSQESIYLLGAKVMRALGLESGGKR